MRTATRKDWRESIAKTFKTTYKIPISSVEVVLDWNIRKQFDGIPELAADILRNGLIEPLLVDLDPDTGKYIVRDGERRFKAILLINESEVFQIEEVEVRPVPGNETEKLVLMMGTGVHKSLYQPVEISAGIMRIKLLNEGISNFEIGQMLGKSRQWVDNMVNLNKLPPEQLEKITKGEKKYTNILHGNLQTDDDGETDDEGGEGVFLIDDFVVIPSKNISLMEEMNGILPAESKSGEGYSETDKLARQMAKEAREEEGWGEKLKDADLEYIRKGILKNCANLEGISKGLRKESYEEHDRVLGYIRKAMQMDIFEAVKGKFKR